VLQETWSLFGTFVNAFHISEVWWEVAATLPEFEGAVAEDWERVLEDDSETEEVAEESRELEEEVWELAEWEGVGEVWELEERDEEDEDWDEEDEEAELFLLFNGGGCGEFEEERFMAWKKDAASLKNNGVTVSVKVKVRVAGFAFDFVLNTRG
jgi:hypothetical protein